MSPIILPTTPNIEGISLKEALLSNTNMFVVQLNQSFYRVTLCIALITLLQELFVCLSVCLSRSIVMSYRIVTALQPQKTQHFTS